MHTFEIIHPSPGALVRYREPVFIVGAPAEVTPQVYVLANDDLWHRQPRAMLLDIEHGLYSLRCYFGYEEHRSGWRYVVVALLSTEALPHTMDVLPEQPPSCITYSVPVVRR